MPDRHIRYKDGKFVLVVSGEVVLVQRDDETFAEFEKRAARER